MATRDIKTRLKLEGEAEYKKQLGDIDSTLRTLRSEMNKVSAEYADNADSVEALTSKNEVLEKQLEAQRSRVSTLREVLEKAAEAYGENDRRTQSWAQKLNNAEAELIKMERSLEDNREAINRLGNETETGSGKMARFGDALKATADKLGIQLPEGLKKTIDKLGQFHPKAALAVTVLGALVKILGETSEKLREMTGVSAEDAAELERLAATTGMNVELLQEFEYAANQLNIPLDSLSDSLKDVTNKAYDAANGNEDLAEKYGALGVSILGADGQLRDSYEIFLDLIDALGEVSNQTERDALAMELINESARQLNPLINQGSEGLKKYAQEARDAGAVLSNEQLKALTDVQKAQLELEAAQKAVSDQMAAEYAPYMEEGLEMTRKLLLQVGDAFDRSNVVDSLGSISVSVASLLEPLAEIGTTLLPAILYVLDPIAGLFAWIADTADATLGLLTLDGNRFWTALGFNAGKGQYSNLQKWQGADEDFDWNTWQVADYNAGGSYNYRGGLTWVGENGPELVNLPAGTRIDTAQESRMGGGDVFNIYVSTRDVKEFNDMVEMAKNARITARMKGG